MTGRAAERQVVAAAQPPGSRGSWKTAHVDGLNLMGDISQFSQRKLNMLSNALTYIISLKYSKKNYLTKIYHNIVENIIETQVGLT